MYVNYEDIMESLAMALTAEGILGEKAVAVMTTVKDAVDNNTDDPIVLIIGGPIDGFNLHGPFESVDAADEFAGQQAGMLGWWITKLNSPDE